MQIPKPTDDDKRRFAELVPDGPSVQVKPVFGNLGAFVNAPHRPNHAAKKRAGKSPA